MNPKEKGSRFERAVSHIIDNWWDVKDKTFWRSENSGGLDQPGDIAPRIMPDQDTPRFPFIIECKHYEKVNLFEVFNKETKTGPKFIKWWKQLTEAQAKAVLELGYPESQALRLLIFRYNNSKIMCAFDTNECLYRSIFLKSGIKYESPIVGLLLPDNKDNILIMDFCIFRSIYTKKLCLEHFYIDLQ